MTETPGPGRGVTPLSVPGRIARWLAAHLLPPDRREFILGDLEELHSAWADRHGKTVADWLYIKGVFSSLVDRIRTHSGPSDEVSSLRAGIGEDLLTDIRHTIRAMGRRSGFVAVVALTLGIGVGAAATVFGMVDQLLLRPLPGVIDSGKAAFLEFATPEQSAAGVSGPLAEAVRESAAMVDGVATFDYVGAHVSTGDRRPLDIRAYTIFGDYFELLEVRPLVGRLLTAGETGPNSDPRLAVISERLWGDLFGRAPDVVGKQFEANGESLTVLGVAGGGFRGTDRTWGVDLWVPRSAFSVLTNYPAERLWAEDSRLNQDFVLRPAPGAGFEAVESELNAILDGIAEANPGQRDYFSDLQAIVHPGINLPVWVRPYVLPALAILSIAGLLILLIPCANVANLLLVRALSSRGEIAVRRALGASRLRIARRAIVESLMLAGLGVIAGFGVAWLISLTIRGESLWGLPGFEGFAVDWSLVAFACGAVVVTALLSGTIPALVAARFEPGGTLRDAGAQATDRHGRLRHAMSALQVGLSMTLLVGSVLLARTVRNVFAVDPGIQTENVYVASIDMGNERLEEAALSALHRRLLDGLEEVPGVFGAALQSFYGPYQGVPRGRVATSADSDVTPIWTGTHWVTAGWFELLGVQAIRGRVFQEGETRSAVRPPVVLTESLATRLFGDTNVVGRPLWIGTRELSEAEVVGVVGELRMVDLMSPPDEALFLPYPPDQTNPITVLTRVESGGAGTPERLQRALEGLAPAFPIPEPQPVRARVEEKLAEQLILSRLLTIFSSLALVLAAVGLYGVIAFAVAGRRREFAIRMALGADRKRITALVLRSALAIASAGTALGFMGAYGLSRLLESRLFGIGALDPASYLGSAGLLVVVAALAAWLPARAAAGTDSVAMLADE